MKSYLSILILVFSLTSCNSTISVENSRQKLLKYREEGYAVKLNDSLIRIDQLILDEAKMKEILIDKFDKIVTIKYDSKNLNIVPIYWVARSNEKDKLLIIDGVPIKPEELDSLNIEMSAFRSVKVLKDSPNNFGRKYKEVILVSTKATTANSGLAK